MRVLLGICLKLFRGILLMIGVLFAAIILLSANNNSLLGIRSYIVLTGSMSPTFDAGSFVIVHEKSHIQVGDIITFNNASEGTVTHRVIEIIEDGGDLSYRTQGDANDTPDNMLVSEKDVLGVAVFCVNGLGNFILFLKQPVILIMFITVIALILFFPEIVGFRKVRV